jgi:hypothetical protein
MSVEDFNSTHINSLSNHLSLNSFTDMVSSRITSPVIVRVRPDKCWEGKGKRMFRVRDGGVERVKGRRRRRRRRRRLRRRMCNLV